MIKIESFASGSSGNLYRINDGETSLLIEVGLPINQIKEKLEFRLSEITGCLISHEHGDHAKSVKDVIRLGMNCYMSPGTAEALDLENHYRIHQIKAKELVVIGSMVVKPFNVQHDANEPLGFLILSSKTGEKLVYITDSFYTEFTFNQPDYLMVECNYSKDILQENVDAGKVHPALAARLQKSHFSLKNVKDFLKANDLSKVREIWLLHLSDRNSNAEQFKKEIQELTGKMVRIAGGG